MFAIVELGGKQYIVKENDILRVEKVDEEAGKSTVTSKVLLVAKEGSVKVGTPYLAGASVEMKVLKSGMGDKVIVFKMKAKKRYRKLRGHRQPFSEVKVGKITA